MMAAVTIRTIHRCSIALRISVAIINASLCNAGLWRTGRGEVGARRSQCTDDGRLQQDGALADHRIAGGQTADDFIGSVRITHLHMGDPEEFRSFFNQHVIGPADVDHTVRRHQHGVAVVRPQSDIGEHAGKPRFQRPSRADLQVTFVERLHDFNFCVPRRCG